LSNDPNKFGSGFVFDEETYKKAKPHFKEALKHFAQADRDLAPMMRELIRYLAEVAKMPRTTIEAKKPYIIHFIEHVLSGEETLDANAGDELERAGAPVAPPNESGSGFVFDDEAYETAKPYFRAGLQHFEKAGRELATEMTPYIRRFMDDVQSRKESLDALCGSDNLEETGGPPMTQRYNLDSSSALDRFDYWRLCDELSVVQAALLIVGADPSEYIDLRPEGNRPQGYDAAKAALVNAISARRLVANVVEAKNGDGLSFGPDWYRTTVMVEDLQAWLSARGLKKGFFFPTPESGPDYLSEFHRNYSSKLAAAVEVWKAVSADAKLRRGKSVKQALVVWLRQHANKFGLTKEDGNPNEQSIEDVAKIANWDAKGEAPKT
jgi:hypothetical protein